MILPAHPSRHAARHAVFLLLLALAGVCQPAGSAWAAKARAEFSFRWDPTQGGPASAEATLEALGLTAGKPSRFEVQYFDIDTPSDTPSGYSAILRKRIVGTTTQLTYKLRGSEPWPGASPLKSWQCPLPQPHDRKEEVDIAFLSADQQSKAYSRSCTHDTAQLDVALPAALQARPNNCKSTMTRLEAGKLKIEQWRLANGGQLLEVSRGGRDNAKDSAGFRDQVVKPLLGLQAQPLQRSKSAMGSECN